MCDVTSVLVFQIYPINFYIEFLNVLKDSLLLATS